ncbi:MAG TPA: DNA polymerase/3'-5' exonuclease PolX [Thermomicrobiaceae bacterium]|nr:DNA polymerase/3'-5' exonuclease PolX [Thermomicrobiaceae bacterium]
MDTSTIARILASYADLLEIAGENVFRAQAYRRAAEALENLAEPLESVDEGVLLTLPGIGPGTAAAIREISDSGRLAALDELLERVPESVLTLLDISGVGAKTAGRLYRELGVTNLVELRRAAESGQVRALKGFGAKQEQRILEGIAFLQSRDDRLNIGEALPAAELIAAILQERLGTRVAIAGSVRRRRETVGDLNLVALATDPVRVGDALASIPGLAEVEATAPDLLRGALTNGVPVRLALSEPARFGTALVQWTGSRAHVEQLLARAGELPAAPDEESLYAALSLPWIPSELRQGRDEVELAAQHRLPNLITLQDLRGDLHLHSDWSDGHATIEQLAEAAAARGYQYLSISDHSGALAVANGLSVERLRAQWRVIDEVNQRVPGVRLLRAAEVEVGRDGSLDYPDEVLAQLDLVVASLHSGLRASRDELTRRIVRVLRNPHVDIVAHPTGRVIGHRPEAEYDWDEVFRVARETGTALEINANPSRQDLKDTLARAADEAGVRLAIDSDAHDLSSLDLVSYGVGLARRAGIEPQAVVNAQSLPDLLAWLQR